MEYYSATDRTCSHVHLLSQKGYYAIAESGNSFQSVGYHFRGGRDCSYGACAGAGIAKHLVTDTRSIVGSGRTRCVALDCDGCMLFHWRLAFAQSAMK